MIGAQLPLHKPDGSFDGSVAITLDVHWFDYLLRAHPLPKGAVAVIYDRNGAILATNDPKVAPAIAAAALQGGPARRRLARRLRVPGMPGVSAMPRCSATPSSSPSPSATSGCSARPICMSAIDFLLPIAMILFAWIAIWFATDRQVTQWIAYLRRIAIAYRSGHYTIRPDLADAPSEFKQLGEAMSEMAEGIQDRDRRLREAVDHEDHPDPGNPSPGEEQSADRDEPAVDPGQPGQGHAARATP